MADFIATKLTIDGIEYTDTESIEIDRSIGDFNGTSNFTIILPNDNGKYKTSFTLNDEVIIYANADVVPATTKIFTGIIEDIVFTGRDKDERVTLSGRDYGAVLQNITIQPIVFINRDCGDIAKTVIEMNSEGLVTTTNVDITTGTILDRISFNQKNVFDALKQLAELSGYYFYVDNNKDVNFILKSSISSGLTFNNTNVTRAKFRQDVSQVFNKIWVYGDNILTGVNYTGGIGAGSIISLPYNPHNTRVSVSSVLQQIGGIYEMDDPATTSGLKYVVDFNKKQIIFVSGTTAGDNIPSSGTSNVTIEYERSTPIVKLVHDNANIALYGPRTKVISDKNIKDYQAAIDAANIFLSSNTTPITQGTIDVKDVINATPGHTCIVNLPFHNIANQTYTIINARYIFNIRTCLNGNVLVLTLNKKIGDFVDTLKDTILRIKQVETGTLEGNYPYLQINTGSFVFEVKNWSVASREIGSSFILDNPTNSLLGSYSTHALGWQGETVYIKMQSGGTW